MAQQDAGGKDVLEKPRQAVGDAIAELKRFKGSPGTDEMNRAHRALAHMGMAYHHLDKQSENPAWEADPGAAMV